MTRFGELDQSLFAPRFVTKWNDWRTAKRHPGETAPGEGPVRIADDAGVDRSQARLWVPISPASGVPGSMASSLWAVPGPCLGIQGSPVRAAEFRAGSVLPFEHSPVANGPYAHPGGLCEGCQRIAARAAFGRRFESRKLQFHNTAFLKASGSLVSVQPEIEHIPDGGSCPEDVRFEQKLSPGEIENGLR